MSPQAIRVRTASGWQDIALTGPQGPQGPVGPTGPVGPAGPIGTMLAFRSTGAQPGSGGVMGGADFIDWSGGARQIVYTTPAILTRGRITFAARWDCQSAAWVYMEGGAHISPAPVADYSGAVSTSQMYLRRIETAHNACPYITPSGSFWVDFAASTTYTIMHAGNGGNGSWLWDASWRMSCLTLEVYPR